MTKREIEQITSDFYSKAKSNSNGSATDVKDRINTAVNRIVALAMLHQVKGKDFRFGTDKKVALEIASMRDDITKIIVKRSAVAKDISNRLNKRLDIESTDWDDKAWIDSIRFGQSYAQRLNTYSNRIKFELEAFIAVGMVKGISNNEIATWFMTNIESPHTNKDILDAFGYAAVRASGILKPGLGGITSAYKSIVRLNDDMMMSSYAMSNNTSWGVAKLYKYVVTANDSLVCASCQANVGFTFPAGDFLTPVHNRCRCREVIILPETENPTQI